MTDPAEKQHDEQLQQLIHDVKGCLHAIGMGVEILKGVRDDDVRFAEVCELIDRERRRTITLLRDYFDA